MKVGFSIGLQHTEDWDRFLASEQHADAPSRPHRTDAELWDEGIALGLEAEPLGFDSIFAVEHHFTPYSFSTNPLQLLAYFAGRTERVDLGTMVVVLPWHHPLRVAEEATMVQNLLGEDRDLLLGVGRGLARREYESFGIEMSESRDRFSEAVEILRLAIKEPRFSYDGKIFKIPETAMRPYPRDERLLDNLYCAWGSPQSVSIAAELGLKPFIIPQKKLEDYHAEMDEFAKIRADKGYEPARPMFVTWVYCAPTEEAAREGALKHMTDYVRTPLHHYEIAGNHFAGKKGYEHYASASAAINASQAGDTDVVGSYGEMWLKNHVWGTPEQCFAKLEALHKTWDPTQVIAVMNYGEMSFEDAQASMRLFAREVLPAAQALGAHDAVAANA